MDGLLTILQSASNLDHSQLPKLIQALEDHQSFGQKAAHEIESVVSQISYQLNNVSSKYEGLLLLRAFLPQCSLDVIEQKGALWITICTKVCQQKKPVNAILVAYDIITKLLYRSVHVPDLAKAITSNLLAKIIDSACGVPAQCQLAALGCLQVCMSLYPGPSGSSRGAIERHLASFVDQADTVLVKEAGKCLLLLQQIRGSGSQGISQKGAWAMLQTQLIGSLHVNFDQIYANTAETYDGGHLNGLDGQESLLKVPQLELSPEPMTRATQLVTRFGNLSNYLRVALLNPYPVPKQVLPSRLLALISRGLSVNCTTLANNLITDNIAVGALIPQMHISLFQLLDALILVLGTHMLPYANNVVQLIIQSLKWTSSGRASGFKRPYCSIRQAAYRSLALWCKVAQAGSLVETVADELVKYTLQDITPFQSEVTLKVLAGARKYLSKKARQKLHKAQNDATNLAQTHSKAFNPHNTKIVYTDSGNEKLCASALNCLNQVILTTGFFLKPVLHKILQENIVRLAIVTVEGTLAHDHLYSDLNCRTNLYAVLNALVLSPNHLCPPPVQYATAVFSVAQITEPNHQLREKCASYLHTIEKILHPQKESLVFPLVANEVADAFKTQQANGNKSLDLNQEESSSDDEDMQVDLGKVASPIKLPEVVVTPATPTTKIIRSDEKKTPVLQTPPPKASPVAEAIAKSKQTEYDSPTSASDAESICSTRSLRARRISVSREMSPTRGLATPPPRKSARLTAINEQSESNIPPSSPLVPDTSRRRSSRLRTTSTSQTGEPILDELVVRLTKIDEASGKETETSAPIAEISNEDDVVNQMAAAFVDEFVDDEVGSD